MEFFTSADGRATCCTSLAASWIAVLLLAAVVLTAVPSYPDNCVPPAACHDIGCNECMHAGCEPYGGCYPSPDRQWYWEVFSNVVDGRGQRKSVS